MSRRDIVQTVYDEFVTESDLSRKAKSWYRRTDETIIVLTLNRSPYGRQYFVTVGVLLRTLDADQTPKDAHCQIRSRLDRLVPATSEHRVNDLFDLEFRIDDASRRAEVLGLLRSELLPALDAGGSLEGLRSETGSVLVRHSSVTDEARAVLAGASGG